MDENFNYELPFDCDVQEISSKTQRHPVIRGFKGSLVTKQSNPRILKEKDII
jgi:hypothetical protein